MKLYINPSFDAPDSGQGGIRRVVEAQHRYLPAHGIDLVKTPEAADIVNCHAASVVFDDYLVFSLHGMHWQEDKWDSRWAYRVNQMLCEAVRQARAVTVPSEWVADVLRRGFLMNPFVVGHGIEVEQWEPSTSEGYVLWNKNRHDPACMPDVMNWLADHALSVPFISTFGRRGPNITLLGRLPHEEMKRYIQHAGVYLSTPRETFGIGMLEAMACGVPVLSFKWGGAQEVVRHKETGYVAANEEDLITGLHYCLEHRDRLGANARQLVHQQYTWEHQIQRYVDAYRYVYNQIFPVKVSVVVTAHNMEGYIIPCLESLCRQTLSDIEIIVVDDASTDNTRAEILSVSDPRIVLIPLDDNVHVSEARNIGFRAARGEYFIPVDGDDWLADNALDILSRGLDQDRSLHIVCGSLQIHDEKGPGPVSQWPPKDITAKAQFNHQNQLVYASLFRREVFDRTGGYRRRIRTGVEDADFWTRALSYGFRASKITRAVTLHYRVRSDSLSHQGVPEDWLAWYPWGPDKKQDPPFAVADFYEEPQVPSYDPKMVSVIIPVGPGHDIYLQDCLDSLVVQSFKNWDVVVINDTGYPWFEGDRCINPYVMGHPYARFIDSDGPPRGPAAARNTGIQRTTAPYFIPLDADDYAQPHMIEALYKAVQKVDGWVYPDWYTDTGEGWYHDRAADWSPEVMIERHIATGVGIYQKKHWEMVGGYDEEILAGEDWEFHLRLLEAGICGTRIASPLFVYRHRTGARREDGFKRLQDVLHYIRKNHSTLYDGGLSMACSSCGGKQTLQIKTSGDNDMSLVWIEYVGEGANKRFIASRHNPGRRYPYSATQRKMQVDVRDAEWMVQKSDFRLLESESKPAQSPVELEESPMMVAEYTPPQKTVQEVRKASPQTGLHTLDLDPKIVSILQDNDIYTVETLSLLKDNVLLQIKGIGPTYLDQIRAALS